MFDDENVHRLFSNIGQVAVFGQHLSAALHACCTRAFAAQGFADDFAHSMMDKQEPEVVRRTWTQLLRQRFVADARATAVLEPLSVALDQVLAARKELLAYPWVVSMDRQAVTPFRQGDLSAFTLSNGGVDFDPLIRDMVNLATLLTLLAEGLDAMDGIGLEHLWGMVAV